ncbi:MAG: gliding motility-associated C-terminal domain-containing protein [Cytophagaceae bacterium]
MKQIRCIFNIALILLIPSLSTGQTTGQNLVPNSSFENTLLPLVCTVYSRDNFNNTMADWKSPSDGSPDILSMLVSGPHCFSQAYPNTFYLAPGQQKPRTGNTMAGITTYSPTADYREYLQVKLTSPLVPGMKYKLSLYVSIGDYSEFASELLGIYFSTTSIYQATEWTLPYTPQVEFRHIPDADQVWTELSTSFIATDPSEYIVIGNFKDNASTPVTNRPFTINTYCYFFIDDVSLSISDPEITGDTIICAGETTNLTGNYASDYKWTLASDPATIISTRATLAVSPVADTDYLLYTPVDTLTCSVKVFYPQPFSLGNDTMICKNGSIQLDPSLTGVNYLWQDGSRQSSYNITKAGEYWLKASNEACATYDTINVNWCPCTTDISMPNLITANSDNFNEKFYPITIDKDCYDFIKLTIYNRWGEKILETSDMEWQPVHAESGVYFWNVRGAELNGKEIDIKGFLHIVQ